MLRVLDVKRIIISIITRIRRTLTMTPGLFTQVGTKTTQLKSRKKYSNVVYYLNINNKRITRHKEFRNLKEKKKTVCIPMSIMWFSVKKVFVPYN